MTGRRGAAYLSTAIALALVAASLIPLDATAATVQGDRIVNNARFTSAFNTSVSASVTVTAVMRTPATIEFLKYTPGATPLHVGRSAYRTGSASDAPFTLLPPPVLPGSGAVIDLSNPVPLLSSSLFHQGEPVFIRVRDLDQNLDRTVLETVLITITDADSGDIEVVRLNETGPDTGIFTGYIQSTGNGASRSYGGTLSVTSQSNMKATYTDIVDKTDTVTCAALVDPAGIVFNSTTGAPVDGVQVTLVNAATGNPATVFGDDGVSVFPSTITTGGTASDPSGRHYDFPPGGFRFPFVAPGEYLFRITLPTGYSAPSTVSDAALQELGPFTIAAGSRLDRFTINPGPSMRIDIPVDPVAGGLLSLHKSAGKDSVSIGDFVPYELSVDNGNNDVPALNVRVNDTLPLGFRYRLGSARINGLAASDPSISPDGRSLLFTIDSIPSRGTRTIRYVAEVTAGAKLGSATNRAVALINGDIASHTATATVLVKSDFLSSKSILMGQVIAGACGAPDRDALKGVEGVRIFLEDGTFVDTDKRGMFHFEGIAVGSHVVQLDLDSLPSGYQVVPCEENTRFSGTSYSQFVDLQGGSMWRVDFHVARQLKVKKEAPEIPPANGEGSDDQKAEITGPASKAQSIEEKHEPEAEKIAQKQNGIQDKEGILFPGNGFVMVQPIHAVRICLNGQLTPHLFLDGKEIPAARIGFTMKDPASGKVLYTYIGVDFGSKGKHSLELKGSDPFGITRVTEKVEVVRSGEIAAIRFRNTDGNIADAKTPVQLQLEVLDAAGEVIPAEIELEIRGGSLKPIKNDSDIPDLSMKETTVTEPGGVERVHLDEKGIALFHPVSSGGLYTIVLGTGKVTAEGETYVKPKMRDWILVGLGEGTVGYNAVSGHMENLTESGQDEHLYDDERIAFYAKGKVKGEWLLTMAYDSAKGKGDVGNRGLFQTIDPNTYYTLYGDAAQQQYDAASIRKIYLKIERDQFYALFGDFDSGLTVTELSRYSRRMNGFKSEWQGKYSEANVFATETDQVYARDEIRGDGTSGLYHLTRGNIVPNSDKITIEIRDRFRSEIIIESRPMNRFTDYSIDYETGDIFFKEPIHSRDDNFNPIFIVAEYETAGRDTGALTYGGRIGAKLLDNRVKAGFTYIREGQASGNNNSYGVDAKWNIAAGTTIRGEFARTDSRLGSTSRDGNAWLSEIEHRSANVEAKLYYRQQDEGFGLGQQNGSETGTRKFGLDAACKLTDNLSIDGQLYRQYNLSTDNVQDVAEARTTYTVGPYSAWLGGRYANDDMGSAGNRSSNQLIIGGSWLTLNKRLTLRAEHNQSISKDDNADFPTRTTFGADFKLTQKVTLFAQQEITSGSSANTNTTSVGVKSTPWEGGTINTSMGRDLNENGDRMFALFGLKQTLKISDKWSVDGGLDRSQTIKENRFYKFYLNVPAASGDGQDFTAVSLGTTYTEKNWNFNSRVELRSSDTDDKWGIVTTYMGEPREGWGWSARLQLFDTKAANGLSTVNGDLRLGMVYRPLYTRWIILDRLDVLYDRQHGGSGATDSTFNMDNWRVVNNLNANFKLDSKTQVSLQYGAKYVLESLDGADYSGYTDLIGVEGRYDLTKKWDLGLCGSALHSWKADQISYSAGLSAGYNVMKNAWVSLGYNLVGFSDKDFSASEYTAQGPFVRFRFKFDQNSVKDAVAWINHL